jgi:hypothetical protein
MYLKGQWVKKEKSITNLKICVRWEIFVVEWVWKGKESLKLNNQPKTNPKNVYFS